MSKIFSTLAVVIVGLGITAVQSVLLMQYWRWYILTVFPDAPELDFLQALALLMVGSIFWTKEPTSSDNIEIITKAIVKVVIYFIAGLLIYSVFFTGLFS